MKFKEFIVYVWLVAIILFIVYGLWTGQWTLYRTPYQYTLGIPFGVLTIISWYILFHEK